MQVRPREGSSMMYTDTGCVQSVDVVGKEGIDRCHCHCRSLVQRWSRSACKCHGKSRSRKAREVGWGGVGVERAMSTCEEGEFG